MNLAKLSILISYIKSPQIVSSNSSWVLSFSLQEGKCSRKEAKQELKSKCKVERAKQRVIVSKDWGLEDVSNKQHLL